MGCCSTKTNVKNPNGLQQAQSAPISQTNQSQMRTMNQIKRINNQNPTAKSGQRIDTPLMTEDNKSQMKEGLAQNQSNISRQVLKQEEPKRITVNISPNSQRKNKIYYISSNFPVSPQYSDLSQWQKVVSKNQQMADEDLAEQILQLRNRNWVKEQIQLNQEVFSQTSASFESLKIIRKGLQINEHFNWLAWAIAHYYFQKQSFKQTYGLPKLSSSQWTEGFDYKGVRIRVLPYEEAYFVINEIKAINYVSVELQELIAMSAQLLQQYGATQKENLHQQVLLPLISGISCGGFFLYATPIIYTQDLDQAKDFYEEHAKIQSKVFGLPQSNSNVIQKNESVAVNHPTNQSFSYLHENIQPEFVKNSLFNFMPILKNVDTRNMVPVIDFEEYKRLPEEKRTNTQLHYILMNLYDVLPKMSDEAFSSVLMRIPLYVNNHISFLPFPKNGDMDFYDLKKMLISQSEQDIMQEDNDDENIQPQQFLQRKKFMKHGWEFTLIEKKASSTENKRATALLASRDHFWSKEYSQAENEDSKLQERMVKQSIFQRLDSIQQQDSKVQGNVVLAGFKFSKELKLKYSMCNQIYSTNLESLFSASVDHVVKVLEQTDSIYNTQSVKDLMHRKGLNLRFLWAILPKLRQHSQRDQIMIEILVRVMRRLINEETKNKCRMQLASTDDQGNHVVQEYYQSNQFEQYKDTVTQLMNSLLKRKVQKNKHVFDEVLLGLFLQRMNIFNFVHHLNLRKEEYFYLESKDILEDIVDAPSRNPVLFINAVQSYFKVDFKVEMLRMSRQDILLFLSKGQPVQKGDIKNLLFRVVSYSSMREQAYFMLARQISNSNSKNSPISKLMSKVKTKTEKDKIKQSFQRPRENDNFNSSSISSRQRGIGPQSISQVNDQALDNQDQKTNRQTIPIIGNNKESLNTIRQYHNMDKAIINDSAEFGSPPLNQSKLTKLNTQSDQIIDFSRVSKRSQFQPTSMAELAFPPIMYRLKTYLSQNPMSYFEEQTKIYIGETLTVLQPFYEMPSLEVVDEWVMILESILKEVHTVHGDEQILLEALVYQAMLIYFYKEDYEEMLKVLQKIRDLLFISAFCKPECLIMIQILTGMFFEEQKDQLSIEAEKSYLTATICLLQLYGDPRGRGNIAIPINLFLQWKLSLLSLAEDKKLHDSEVAEELFDATLRCLFNHKKLYKTQQIQQLMNQKNQNQNMQNQLAELLKPTSFDIEIEKQELSKQLFDIRKYKHRTQTLTYASVPKSNSILRQQKQDLSIVSQTNKENKENIKSKSYIPGIKKKKNEQNEYDLEVSDIDLEVEDESQNAFSLENFKPSQISIGICPFQHWSLYRWQIAQILQAHNSVMSKNTQAQTQYQRQIYREMLYKSVSKDLLYQWVVKFNPIQYSCGIHWSSETIRNVIFSQNQQMVSSSGSSVVMSSQHNLSSSHHSMTSSTPSSAKEKRNLRLGSYTQILGKEVGAISKQELSGVLFSFGTDNSGQLGLDLIALDGQHSQASLKVLYPRMIVSLRDEIIKEVCCGHSHTLVTNVQGQIFAWGNNEYGQLGLGDNAPKFIRKPILNTFIQNVQRLSAGHEHSLAITKNGELFMWGSGGMTGQGNLIQQNKPVRVEFFSKTKITHAVCGGLHTVAVTKDGEAYSWGSTEGGQLGLPESVLQTLCEGQEIPVSIPQKVPILQDKFITQVACGEAHSIAMTREGNLYGWGQSNYGQLGLGFSSDSFEPGIGLSKSKVPEPQEITGLKHERVSRIFCGATFSLFLTDKGDLYGCGVNDLGQLGLDTFMEEMQIASLEKAKRGKHHQTSDVTLPTKVICFQGIALHNIACGENHSLAVSGDGMNMLWAWGMYKNGQLGLGEVSMKMNPRPVQTLCSSLIQRIACGGMHSIALIGDSSNVSTYSAQYYQSNEQISSYWLCNIRPLALRNTDYYDDLHDYEVPDDGEGRVKNPK